MPPPINQSERDYSVRHRGTIAYVRCFNQSEHSYGVRHWVYVTGYTYAVLTNQSIAMAYVTGCTSRGIRTPTINQSERDYSVRHGVHVTACVRNALCTPLCTSLCAHPSAHPSAHPFVHTPLCTPLRTSLHTPLCTPLCAHPSAHPCTPLCAHPSAHPCTPLCTFLCAHPSAHPSAHPFVHTPLCTPFCTSLHTPLCTPLRTSLHTPKKGGRSVPILLLKGVQNPNAKDFIALYCPETSKENDYLDLFNVDKSPTFSQGYGNHSVQIYNIRTNCEMRYFRSISKDHQELVTKSNVITFQGGSKMPLQIHLALTGDPTQMRVMWVSGTGEC